MDHGGDTPLLIHPRDSILPAVAVALSVRGETHTRASGRQADEPELHPLVAGFLAELPESKRQRWVGRCPEARLLSDFLGTVEAERRARRRPAKRPLSLHDARRALRGAKVTARHIRESGDPLHGTYAASCPACAALLEHFHVDTVSGT